MSEQLELSFRRRSCVDRMVKGLLDQPRAVEAHFRRGAPEGLVTTTRHRWIVTTYDLLAAYGRVRARTAFPDADPLSD